MMSIECITRRNIRVRLLKSSTNASSKGTYKNKDNHKDKKNEKSSKEQKRKQ